MIVTITNQKGGVGKTTTAYSLCTGLKMQGLKVLAVDIDPQSNLSFTSGYLPTEAPHDLYQVMSKRATAKEAIVKAKQGYDIITGSLELAGADLEFNSVGKEYLLREALEEVAGEYDFIIIDTPPTLSVLTVNALTASECVIVPMSADVYSLQGLSQLQKLIDRVQRYCNPNLYIDGLLLTKYSNRAIINQHLKSQVEQAAETLKTRVYKTTIREAVAVKEAQLMKGNVFEEYPNANITQDFKSFISEFTDGKR